jgi:hypothetical protein
MASVSPPSRRRGVSPRRLLSAVVAGQRACHNKAVNLLTTNPGELLDYVNRPVGQGRAPSRPLKPLVAVPTTTGTGAESTTICVLDVLAQKVKTGISHPDLRPTLAVVDPALTVTQPAAVTASSGMDILCHALEARGRMALAATMAGLGFGNAGSTSRTPTPTRSPGGSRTSGPRTTRRTSRSCRTAWPCR